MRLLFDFFGKERVIDCDLSKRKPYSECDEVVEMRDAEGDYIVYFGIDENTGVCSDVPCCIDVYTDSTFVPIYDFTIVD